MWNSSASTTSATSNSIVSSGAAQSPQKSLPQTKGKIWPRPNYRRLVLDGLHPNKVRIYRFLYEWVPNKPRVALPRSSFYFFNAVTLFANAASEWLHSPSASTALTLEQFSSALRQVLNLCWIENPSDHLFFTARHEKSDRGCELHVILGDDSPFKRVPTFKAFDLVKRQMHLGWPVPRPSYESKGFFILSPSDITFESGAGFVRARWFNSSAKDRGFFSIFDDMDEANDWLNSLSPHLVFTDRPQTRLISTFAEFVDAQNAAKALAKPKKTNISTQQTPVESPVLSF